MLTRIGIKNFRGYEDVDFALSPVSVLLGANSSGKTSILHAIRLASAAVKQALGQAAKKAPQIKGDRIILCSNLFIQDHEVLMPVASVEELFTNRSTTKPISIKLTFEPQQLLQDAEVELTCGHNSALKLTVSVRSAAALAEQKSPSGLRQRLQDCDPIALFVPQFYGVTVSESYLTSAAINRHMQGGEQSRLVRNLVARLSGTEFEGLNNFLLRSVGAQISKRPLAQDAEDLEYLEVYFKDTNGPLELSCAGSGLIGLIALYAAITRYRPARQQDRSIMILLDEPEAHLHPRLQGDIGAALAEQARDSGAQLFIATHSVEMINRLGQRPGVALLSVNRARSQVIALDGQSALLRELEAFCDLTPFASINFLSTRRLLFHEGPTDKAILTSCARVYFRDDPLRLQAFQKWNYVELSGISNAGSAEVLTRLLGTDVEFHGMQGADPVRIVRVRDRDYQLDEQKVGVRSISPIGSKVHFLDVVWPRHSIESLFLEPACLAAWLAPAVGPGGPTLAELESWIADALVTADQDRGLDDKAQDGLRQQFLKDKTMPEAIRLARETARNAPAIWQRGKDRGAFVLAQVRKRLQESGRSHLTGRVRGSITKLVEDAQPEQLGAVGTLIPPSLRDVLDRLVA